MRTLDADRRRALPLTIGRSRNQALVDRPPPRRRLGPPPRHRRARRRRRRTASSTATTASSIDGVAHAAGRALRLAARRRRWCSAARCRASRRCTLVLARQARRCADDARRSSASGSLITPIEPRSHARPGARSRGAAAPLQAVYANAFGRLEAAVASSCGSQHAVNEDAHSALDGSGRLFVVADGVGGGAMAQTASRLLVAAAARARSKASRSTPTRVRARDARRRPGDRRARSRASPSGPGAATVVLCAPLDALAVALAGRLGRRLPRLSLVGARRRPARPADARRHLRPPRRDAAARRLAATTRRAWSATARPPAPTLPCTASAAATCSRSAATACTSTSTAPTGAACSRRRRRWPQRCEALVALARTHGSVDDATVLLLQRSASPSRATRAGAAAPRSAVDTERSER